MPWSEVQLAETFTNSSVTSLSEAFTANVTAGNALVILATAYAASETITFSDSQTNTYATLGSYSSSDTGATLAIAFAVAKTTGACTPEASWASGGGEIYIGEFVPPSGTISQDGTAGTGQATSGGTSTSPINTACSGTSGTSDLLLNLVALYDNYTSQASPWVELGAQNGNGAAYAVNVAGSTAGDVWQGGSEPWASLIVALKATATSSTYPWINVV